VERTLVILKPDAVQRGLIGQITARLEQRGLKLVGMKLIHIDEALAARHYAVHKGKPFYDGLIQYITSSPVVVQVWQGKRVIEIVRRTCGATNPIDADLAPSAPISAWRSAAISFMPPTARRLRLMRFRCTSRKTNWSTGRAPTIAGSTNSRCSRPNRNPMGQAGPSGFIVLIG